MLSERRVLVTGGAGFIGSFLCEKLLDAGGEVLCVANFFTGRRANVAHLLSNPHFELMRHDVTFPLFVEVDEIFNLACPASPIHYKYDPMLTTKTSAHGAINMLGLAKRTGAKILQASTSEVYGDPEVHPQKEDYWGNLNPLGPRACYDEGKRCAETLFFDYHRRHDTPVKIARIFNTYADGGQTRSFCYVDDLVRGLLGLMGTGNEVTGPINMGNPKEFSILQLAELIIELTDASSKLVTHPLP